jgi:nitrite reductase/ring-hydroxylating ferredoxin subunit
MDEFIRICKTSELKNKRGKKFVIDADIEIAVFKTEKNFYAVSNICPHNHSPVIFEGFVDDELYVTCPIHCYRFHLESGKVPPGTQDMSGRLETYKTKIINDELWIEKKKKKKMLFNW